MTVCGSGSTCSWSGCLFNWPLCAVMAVFSVALALLHFLSSGLLKTFGVSHSHMQVFKEGAREMSLVLF